jgi:site-specific DNA recombinase
MVKNGKRYRYYFMKATAKDSNRQSRLIRLPACDVERQVALRLQSFLQSRHEVMKGLILLGDQPELAQQLLTAAKQRAEGWGTASPAAERDFLRKVIRRVLVYGDGMCVEVSRGELRDSFTANRASCGTASPRQEESHDDLIRLTVEARLKRCGGEMRLVISPDSARSQQIPPILKAIVRAYQWREGILAGESSKRIVAAKRLDLNETCDESWGVPSLRRIWLRPYSMGITPRI